MYLIINTSLSNSIYIREGRIPSQSVKVFKELSKYSLNALHKLNYASVNFCEDSAPKLKDTKSSVKRNISKAKEPEKSIIEESITNTDDSIKDESANRTAEVLPETSVPDINSGDNNN